MRMCSMFLFAEACLSLLRHPDFCMSGLSSVCYTCSILHSFQYTCLLSWVIITHRCYLHVIVMHLNSILVNFISVVCSLRKAVFYNDIAADFMFFCIITLSCCIKIQLLLIRAYWQRRLTKDMMANSLLSSAMKATLKSNSMSCRWRNEESLMRKLSLMWIVYGGAWWRDLKAIDLATSLLWWVRYTIHFLLIFNWMG